MDYMILKTIVTSIAAATIALAAPAHADDGKTVCPSMGNGITNARFFAGDTRAALPELVQQAGRPDLVVVDPPRAGLSKKVVQRIVEAAPRRVVYVSCNPTTLAPNAAEMVAAGWSLKKVRPVDMFPQTRHLECVVRIGRGDRPAS